MNKFKLCNLTPYGAVPSARQLRHLRFFSKKAFFHFGVNTFTDLEWGQGTESTSVFNPTDTDVRQWIKTIKAAGFTLAILTVKHHDGFCLWPSKYNDHNISKSPYKDGKGDLIREFTDACHEMGVNVGLYLSPWDRNSKLWGSDDYSTYFNNQLTEILSNYGRIDEVWWDGAGSFETRYDWGLWAHTVRNLQPEAVIFGSIGATPFVEMRWVGNESGYAPVNHYSTIDASSLFVEIPAELASGKPEGERFIPAEVDVSIRPGWFFHEAQDDFVKTPEKLIKIWLDSVGKGCMMLLNFPPDRRGLVHEKDAANALEAHRIISSTFAVNLAEGGSASADSVRHPLCEPDMMLCDNYDSFYAAADDNITPTITVQLPHSAEFDCLSIGEYIELGQRVRAFKAEALVDGKWQLLGERKVMGYKQILCFDPVTTDTVRISITAAAAAPVIREFGLHKFSKDIFKESRALNQKMSKATDLTKLPTANIIREPNSITVQFGGIYPFNTVKFNGSCVGGRYRIYAFDGAKFYEIYNATRPELEQIVRLEQTIEGSYQLKIEATGGIREENLNLQIYEL